KKVSGLSRNTVWYCGGTASTGMIAEDRKNIAVDTTGATCAMSRRYTPSEAMTQETATVTSTSGASTTGSSTTSGDSCAYTKKLSRQKTSTFMARWNSPARTMVHGRMSSGNTTRFT